MKLQPIELRAYPIDYWVKDIVFCESGREIR